MPDSILNDIKSLLGLPSDYTPFDAELILQINSVFTVVWDLGVGPTDIVAITDSSNEWSELGLPVNQLNMVKTFVHLKVKLAFDPPTMGFHLDALKGQIQEQEWRLRERREALIPVPEVESEVSDEWCY